MTQPLLKLSIRGFEPKTYGKDDVQRKIDLRDLILKNIPNIKEIQTKCRGKQLALDVCFYLLESTGVEGRRKKDLDNMLKIFCDTLPDYLDQDRKNNGVGLIEDKSDDLIFEIHCMKKLVSQESDEGIDFTISELN